MQDSDWQAGERIRLFRKTVAGQTQAEFAENIGVTRQTMNAYERDRQRPNMRMIQAICTQYDLSLRWLLTGEGEMRHSRRPDYMGVTEDHTPEQHALIEFINENSERATKITHMLMDGGIVDL